MIGGASSLSQQPPHWAILASAILIAFVAAALPIEAVASAADIMFLLLFIQVLVVLIALRRKRICAEGPAGGTGSGIS